MKLLCSAVLGCALAQSESADDSADRFVGYDYGSYGYQADYDSYGNKKKNYGNTGYETGYSDPYASSDPYGYEGKNQYGTIDADKGQFNGLKCWTCDVRIRQEFTQTDGVNAFKACKDGGVTQPCRGEERVCMTETRARYDKVVEIHAGCKAPEACVALWRRNERYTLPFMLYGAHSSGANNDNLGTAPIYMNDECEVDDTPSHGKFSDHRAQYESVCRHCCVAALATHCNFVATSPLHTGCAGDDTAACSTALATSTQSTFAEYTYIKLKDFMEVPLNAVKAGALTPLYPMPVEGRNSVPMEKFSDRKNAAGTVLKEQADLLSMENTDFQDKRLVY